MMDLSVSLPEFVCSLETAKDLMRASRALIKWAGYSIMELREYYGTL